MMLMKTLTAAVLSVSLALTSLAPTQVQAGLSDEEKIAGLLTLFLLGAAISRHNDRPVNANPPRPPQATPPRGHQDWRVLPSECRMQATTRRAETIRFFGQRCLRNNYSHINRLPQSCHVQFRTQQGHPRQGYLARCLRQAGFRTDRR